MLSKSGTPSDSNVVIVYVVMLLLLMLTVHLMVVMMMAGYIVSAVVTYTSQLGSSYSRLALQYVRSVTGHYGGCTVEA